MPPVHSPDHVPGLGKARRPEQHPGGPDLKKGEHHREFPAQRNALQPARPSGDPLDHEKDPVCAPPEYEGPGGSVPESAKEHRDQDGKGIYPVLGLHLQPRVPLDPSHQGVGEREKQVVTEPQGEGHVPARPEIGDRFAAYG